MSKAFYSVVAGLAFLLAFNSGQMSSQTIVAQPTQFTKTVQTIPGAISTSLTCIVGYASGCLLKLTDKFTDPYVCGADFTATGQTITIQDAAGVLWIVNGGILGATGAPAGWAFTPSNAAGCRLFPGGVYIQAGSSGVTGRLTISYNPR